MFFKLVFTASVAINAVKVSLVVGTILAMINHGESILNGELSTEQWIKIGLNYFVPYCVSSYSAAKALLNKQAD